MNSKLLISLILISSLIALVEAKRIYVSIADTVKSTGFYIDEEKTVGDLLNLYLKGYKPEKNSRLEGSFGHVYKNDKTLREAGIKHNATLKYRSLSKIGDIGMSVLSRMTFINQYKH